MPVAVMMLQSVNSLQTEWTVEKLQEFERDIADVFNAGKIRAPVHLSGGNEQQLIDIFKNVGKNDWVFTTWRSHYHCLLKGVPPHELKYDIVSGKSITLNYPKYRILSSAIVGGILPIALGVAWSIKRHCIKEHVWVFVGDMTARTGIFNECGRYALGHDLPVTIVVEDNGLSVCTPTLDVWDEKENETIYVEDYEYYEYDLKSHWPHAGAGKRVQF